MLHSDLLLSLAAVDPAAAIATAAYQTQRAAPLRRKSQLRK